MSTREDIAAERAQLADLTARFGPYVACQVLFAGATPPEVEEPARWTGEQPADDIPAMTAKAAARATTIRHTIRAAYRRRARHRRTR